MHGDRARRMRPDEDTGGDEAQNRPEAEPLEQNYTSGRCRQYDDNGEKN